MSKKSGSRVQRYLFAGVLTIIPLWITWIVLSFLFRQLSSLGDPWVRALANTVSKTLPALSEMLLHPWLQPVLATILILISYALSIPAVWLLMNDWLQDFVYRYQISPLIFLWTILLILIPTALTVSYQSYKAATANPADSIWAE